MCARQFRQKWTACLDEIIQSVQTLLGVQRALFKFMEIAVTNVPVMNLRIEFEEYLCLFRDPNFKQAIFNCQLSPVRIPNLSWHGMPNDLLTLMLQRTVVGLESYVPAAIEYELSNRGDLSSVLKERLKNPFSFDRSGVVALYEKLPELLHPSLKLSAHNNALFGELKSFYKSVRNPIFHGGQVAFSGENYDRVTSAFELIARVYDWIDSWYVAFPTGWQHMRTPNKTMEPTR